MKTWIIRLLAALFIGVGLYGTLAVGIFHKRYGMYAQISNTQQHNDRYITPTINKRIAKLKALPTNAPQMACQQIIMWQAVDTDTCMYLTASGQAMLLSLLVSLFGILFGIQLLLWNRQARIQKQLHMMTQQGVPDYRREAAPQPER